MKTRSYIQRTPSGGRGGSVDSGTLLASRFFLFFFVAFWFFCFFVHSVSRGTRVIRPGGNPSVSAVAMIDTPDMPKPKSSGWMPGSFVEKVLDLFQNGLLCLRRCVARTAAANCSSNQSSQNWTRNCDSWTIDSKSVS